MDRAQASADAHTRYDRQKLTANYLLALAA